MVNAVHAIGDVVGSGDNAPLNIMHVTADGGVLNKPYTGFNSSYFDNYVVDVLDNLDNFPHVSVIGDISNVDAATQAAARTNPSRPYVDVVADILQLHEIADFFRVRGNALLDGRNDITRRVGNENIRWEFGFLPVYRDVVNLLRFNEQVKNRVAEVNRLRSSGGLRRTVDIGKYSNGGKVSLFVQTQNTFIRGYFDVVETLNIRAHCRWMATDEYNVLGTPESISALVRRVIGGNVLDASTLWQIIPWSWLLDWCGTVGDYFAAHRNIIPAYLTDVSVMRHTQTSWSLPAVAFDDVTMTPITVTRESKTRATSFVAPVAHFPFLSGEQLGILASLFAAKAR